MTKKNRSVPELKVRMALAGKAFGYETQDDWLSLIDLDNTSSISRALKSSSISDDAIEAICSQGKFDISVFFGPLDKLGAALRLTPGVVETIIRNNSSKAVLIGAKDADLIGKIRGRYFMVYASREMHDHDIAYTTVEELMLDEPNPITGTFSVAQKSNHVTGGAAAGTGKCRSERISMQWAYSDAMFPDSQVLVGPLVPVLGNIILAGLYMDVNLNQQIWATQTVIFQVSDDLSIPTRFDKGSELHKAWEPILENRLGDRHRLMSRNGDGDSYLDAVRTTVRMTKGG
jgi:hypothetical protein